ncbi:unnamed protein product [Mytilus coruscus]|uniref:Uncharacterized protein n=1 Tax=Mytilus coruscus TaxID=42192 RepID=A0A6J8ARM6_MYTCO|nr:unnamed protein product [Mytilus coruscus]
MKGGDSDETYSTTPLNIKKRRRRKSSRPSPSSQVEDKRQRTNSEKSSESDTDSESEQSDYNSREKDEMSKPSDLKNRQIQITKSGKNKLFNRSQINSNADKIIICGDFNDDQLNHSKQKLRKICNQNSLYQIITDATNSVKDQCLYDLIMVNDPDIILYSEVGENILENSIRYHCPISASSVDDSNTVLPILEYDEIQKLEELILSEQDVEDVLKVLKYISNWHRSRSKTSQPSRLDTFTWMSSNTLEELYIEDNIAGDIPNVKIINGLNLRVLILSLKGNDIWSCEGSFAGVINVEYYDMSGWTCEKLPISLLYGFPNLKTLKASGSFLGHGFVNNAKAVSFLSKNLRMRLTFRLIEFRI